jgi:ABC-type lipoprotein export system ATPase subunit/ABC-type lipoprotein release transport system permease subunit
MFELIDVSKKYKTKRKSTIFVLNSISFSLPNSGLACIIGKSGCGKSTLINLLSLIEKPTNGVIKYNGNNLNELNEKEIDDYRAGEIGIIFQDNNLFTDYNVAENIIFTSSFSSDEYSNSLVANVLDQVNLTGFEKRDIKTLSGGEKQRVAIARTIIKSPKVILADEPTGSLDNETGYAIFQLLKDLSKERLVVIVTHNTKFALEFADNIIKIEKGNIVENNVTNPLKDNNIPITKKKTKVNFRSLARYSFLTLLQRKARFIIGIIICFLSLTTFALGINFSLYSMENFLYRTIKQSSDITIVKQEKENDEYNEVGFSDEDISYFSKNSDKYSYKESYSSIEFYLNYVYTINFNSYFINGSFTGVIEIDESFINEFNYPLIGKLPEIGTNQIVISKYMYEGFLDYGFKNDDKTISPVYDYSDVLNKEFKINSDIYSISGIIDTHFNSKHYNNLKSYKAGEIHNDFDGLLGEIYALQEYSSISKMYVAKGWVKNQVTENGLEVDSILIKPKNKQAIKDIINICLKNEKKDSGIVFGGILKFYEEKTNSIFINNSSIFIYISLGLSAVSMILIYFLMNESVILRASEVGIMRALGASKKIVSLIFIVESLLIALAISVSSITFYSLFVFIINLVLKTIYGYTFTILEINILELGGILLSSIIVSILSAIIPIIFKNKKSINFQINSNKN